MSRSSATCSISEVEIPVQQAFRVGVVQAAALVGTLFGFVFFPTGITTAQEAGGRDQLRMLGQCRGCSFEDLDVSNQRMTGVDLTEATFRNVEFSGSALNIAIFDFAILENVSFASADMNGVSFSGARLINVSFQDAELRGAVFEDATLIETDIQEGRLCNTQMPNETMDNSDCD
ncbi:pentapeptide repeat-containing protein [Roseibacterium sp. SDUM158017]|uniref:pentapeptide repeat-containing protein n=1 Tax=Roseicyclus salinarum TaxID=3036773 RepID=UPI0024151F0D|nr:pentapeptide repeat-containing protein [Roseibacterium sp. SDUM158017]MDG4650637.1 pentapeptide repeat-containing protein [Roseibacterium sp. SDUM158017]